MDIINVQVNYMMRNYPQSQDPTGVMDQPLTSSFKKVRVAYNNCFRMVFKLPRSCSANHMFVYNSVLSFGELLRKYVCNFILRVNSSHNYLVTSVAGVTYESSHLRKHWRDILYTNLPRAFSV